MTIRPLYSLLIIMLCVCAHSVRAEAARQRHNITFVVKKADIAKNVAARFHVPFKELKKLNAHLHRGELTYQGKQLLIPVWMRPKRNARTESIDFSNLD